MHNTTAFQAKQNCGRNGVANLNTKIETDIKNFSLCLEKNFKKIETPVFQINFGEKTNYDRNSNFEKVVFVHFGVSLRKDRVPKNLLFKNIVLFCQKSQLFRIGRIISIIVISIASFLLVLVGWWYRLDINVCLFVLYKTIHV